MSGKTSGKINKDFLKEKDGYLYYVINPQKGSEQEPFLPRFVNFKQKNLPTSNSERYSEAREISYLRVFTFFVINNGINPVTCQVEMSPDGVTWYSAGELEYTIAPGQNQVIVPQFFLRFARIKYKNKNPGFYSTVTIWFQGQS